LREATRGIFPEPWPEPTLLPPPGGRIAAAIVAFGGHNVIASGLPASLLRPRFAVGDLAAPINTAFVSWLAARLEIRAGNHALVLAATASESEPVVSDLRPRDDVTDRPLITRGKQLRTDLRVFGDEAGTGLVTIGRGLAGRYEMGFEVIDTGHGVGSRLARAALGLVPANEPLFAQVALGNVASIRALLNAGYRPICAEVLFVRPTQI
jgi:hypothetical protein